MAAMAAERVPFTPKDLERACDDLATLHFFPHDSRASVKLGLAAMCPHLEALNWTVSQATARLTDWPSLAGLRGILCSKYDAADGIDHLSTLPYFRAEDAEARGYEEHLQLKAGAGADAAALKRLGAGSAAPPAKEKACG